MIVSQFIGKGTSNTATTASGPQPAVPAFTGISAYSDRPLTSETYNQIPQHVAPIWPMGSSLDLIIYVAPSTVMPALKQVDNTTLILAEQDFRIGNWSDSREIDTTFAVPREVQNNGTLYAHFYVALHGKALDPLSQDYDAGNAYHFFRPLNQVLPKKRVRKAKNLLKASDEDEEISVDEGPKYTFQSYYHPNFTMSIIPDSGINQYPTIHPAVRQHMHLEATGARDISGQNGWYYPILFVNTFWQLRDHMTELNDTIKTLPLHITLNNMNNWKFSLYASIDEGTKQNQRQAASGGPMPAGGDGSEFEEFKRVLVDTNIWLLATTGIVSILHMIFEALAFKSDISHWRKKKDNVGISVRTILANVFMQTVIFLYLMDNSDGTSWMILLGQGMGILIEAWKITKVVDVRIRDAAPGALIPYKITFEDKGALSETEKKTQEYDEIAFQYLFYVAIPLLGAYAVYSLIYDTHKSWYSFVITTLVGSVYAYGFLMMVPSLYINYRLKVGPLLHFPLYTLPSLCPNLHVYTHTLLTSPLSYCRASPICPPKP